MEQMEEPNEPKFKQLLRQAGADKPAGDFTGAVMRRVQEEAALRVLVRNSAAEAPSAAFTKHIMAQIAPAPAAPRPVISRQVWYWIAAGWAVLLVACLFVPGNEQSALAGRINALLVSNDVLAGTAREIPQPVTATIIALSSLLLLDYFLRNNRMPVNKTAGS
ncbi:MAG: hypothetical protein ACO1N1_11950 [Dyadobacter fermentans]